MKDPEAIVIDYPKGSIKKKLDKLNIEKKSVSAIMFIYAPTELNVKFIGLASKNKNVSYVKTPKGIVYQSCLYRINEDGIPIDIETKELELNYPNEYFTKRIEDGYFGMVVKKTRDTESNDFIKKFEQDLISMTSII